MRPVALRTTLVLLAATAGGALLGWFVAGRAEQSAAPRGPVVPAAAAVVPAAPDAATVARARELARRLTVVDTHIDLPYRLTDQPEAERDDPGVRTEKGDFDHPRAVEGGLDVAWMSIYVPASYQKDGGARALADSLIDLVEGIVARHPDEFALAPDVAAAEAAIAAGKIALPLGIENGAAFEDDLANVRHFHERGVRYTTLTHGEDNLLGDASYSKPETRAWHGLSPFGREVVTEMNRLGILVDLSHVSDETFDEAIELTQAPPIASHSSCRHFTPGFERNLDDERIRKLAAKGGVLQINFGSSFVTAAANAWSVEFFKQQVLWKAESKAADGSPELKAWQAKYMEEHPLPRASVNDVADHVDHVVRLVGIDHVGIGSDFDGVGPSLPTGLEDVSKYPNLVAVLLQRGYSDDDLAKVLGGNLLRVWREAEAVAARLRTAP